MEVIKRWKDIIMILRYYYRYYDITDITVAET